MEQHNFAEGPEMPLGLGMALAQDVEAMQIFASLPHSRQQEIIQKTHSVHSKQEMRELVQKIRTEG